MSDGTGIVLSAAGNNAAARPDPLRDNRIRDRLEVRNRHLYWVLVAVALAALPHVAHLPLWVDALAIGAGIWRVLAQQRRWSLPPPWLRIAMVLISFAGVLAHYQTVNGVEAGSALLVVMAAMKLTETRARRDHIVLLYIGYFLVAAQFLYSQSILLATIAMPTVVLLTGALLQVSHDGEVIPPREVVRISGALLGYGIPVMLVLFVLFPRVPGPFWAIQGPKSSAFTGLSDNMEPGSISNLIGSDSVAFRVNFEDEIPSQQDLYWRGPVLDRFDGKRWTNSATPEKPGYSPQISREGRRVRYEVTLEPHNKHWLFALPAPDPVSAARASATITRDYQLLAPAKLKELTRYSMAAYLGSPMRHMTEVIRDNALEVPADGNPRTRAMMREWRREGLTDREIASRALRMIREQEYYYTLQPPLLGDDRIDEFLFETRRGFCEHFSSAYAVMMRMAGIPARVVTGYQGGELNPSPILGGHLTVRQSDAHAWTEIWLDDAGWARVDPTGFIAPERIEQQIVDMREDRAFGRHGAGVIARVRLSWDALDNAWNEWVLGYGPKKQASLMRSLGVRKPDAYKLVGVLAVSLAVTALALFLILNWRTRARDGDAVARAYARFCRKLARVNLRRAPSEGPADFAARAAAERPDLAPMIERITGLYLRQRYLGAPATSALREMRSLVAGLRT